MRLGNTAIYGAGHYDALDVGSPLPSAAPFTLAAGGRRESASTGADFIVSLNRGTTSNHAYSLGMLATGNTVLRSNGGSTVDRELSGTAEDVFYFMGGALDSNDDWAVWANGSEQTGNTDITGNVPTSIDTLSIGAKRQNFVDPWDGEILYGAVWDVFLTADERAALGAGISPIKIRPQNLIVFAIHHGTAPIDVMGNVTFSLNTTAPTVGGNELWPMQHPNNILASPPPPVVASSLSGRHGANRGIIRGAARGIG